MTEFEKVLQECLYELEEGTSTVEECLHRYPRYAAQLKPILLASSYLDRARDMPISDEFKARVRQKVMQEVRAHPRRPARSGSMFLRLSAGLAAALLTLLVTGTAYAQRVLPGNAFYAWKLASESAWRAVSSDPVGTDLKIAERRAVELIAVSKDPQLYPQALKTYLATTDKIKSEVHKDDEARILPLLDSQMEKLIESGVALPQPEQNAAPTEAPALAPAATSLPGLSTPEPTATELPQVVSTLQVSPKIVPTSPRNILPTAQSPQNILPTIEVPPPLR